MAVDVTAWNRMETASNAKHIKMLKQDQVWYSPSYSWYLGLPNKLNFITINTPFIKREVALNLKFV